MRQKMFGANKSALQHVQTDFTLV